MATILVVDDHAPTRALLRALFGYKGHRVALASDGRAALEMAAGDAPDLVLADVVMPGMDGFSFVRELRKQMRGSVPIIMMSASLHEDRARALAADCGASGYLAKPFDPELALQAVAAALSGQGAPAAGAQADDADISGRQRALFADTLARKVDELERLNEELEGKVRERTCELEAANRKLSEQANRDSLTGLFNRRYLDDTLPREIERCRRTGGELAVLLLDLDHFKRINDSRGHQAGDELLRRVADALAQASRGSDIACRYGGEEFVLVLPGAAREVALRRAETLRARISSQPMDSASAAPEISVSIGIATLRRDGLDADALLRAADKAMYRAKQAGRNRVVEAA